MTKHIYINHIAFNYIKNREKLIEGRIKKGIFNDIYVGENIIFVCNKTKNKCLVEITKINIYNSVFHFLKNEEIIKIIPYCDNFNTALNIYKKHYQNKIYNTSYNFIAIYLKII